MSKNTRPTNRARQAEQREERAAAARAHTEEMAAQFKNEIASNAFGDAPIRRYARCETRAGANNPPGNYR